MSWEKLIEYLEAECKKDAAQKCPVDSSEDYFEEDCADYMDLIRNEHYCIEFIKKIRDMDEKLDKLLEKRE